MTDPASIVLITYTNHRGETADRRIVPLPDGLRFAECPWHGGRQWLLDAMDADRGVLRTFAMKDVHGWRPADGPADGPDGGDGTATQRGGGLS